MIDASIVQAPKQSLSKEEKATVVEENAMPVDWSPPKRRQKDLDARWTKEARQILLRLQAVGERGQALQAYPQNQDQYCQRARHPGRWGQVRR